MTPEPDPRIGWWTLGVMVVLGVVLALVIPDSNQPEPGCALVPRAARVAGQVEVISCAKVHGRIDAGEVRVVLPGVAVASPSLRT